MTAPPDRPLARPCNPVRYVDTPAGLDELGQQLLEAHAIGLDVETTFHRHELCLIQLGTREQTWLVDPLALRDLRPLAPALESTRLVKVIHNASFERRVFARKGIRLANVFDTLTVSRRLRGYRIDGGHRLAVVCARELGLHLDKSEQTSDWRRRPLTQRQLDYAALDAEVLPLLYDALEAERARR